MRRGAIFSYSSAYNTLDHSTPSYVATSMSSVTMGPFHYQQDTGFYLRPTNVQRLLALKKPLAVPMK